MEGKKTTKWYWKQMVWITGVSMLLMALIAKQFVGEVSWVERFAQTGAFLIGVGVVIEFTIRKTGESAYRYGLGLALVSALLLGWVNGAVGIIGSEDNQANLMFAGVLLIGVIGTILARLKPRGMAIALFAMAIAQTLAALIALIGRLGAPYSEPLEILLLNGAFIALFVGAAVLFKKAAQAQIKQNVV